MLTLMMSLATVLAVDTPHTDWLRALRRTCGITLGIALPIGLMWEKTTDTEGVETITFGLEDYPTRFWSYVAIALLSLLLLAILLKWIRRGKRRFLRYAIRGTMLITVVYSIFFIALGQNAERRHPQAYHSVLSQRREGHFPAGHEELPRRRVRRHGQPGHVLADSDHPGVPQHRSRLHHGVLPDDRRAARRGFPAGNGRVRPARPDLLPLAL